MPAPAPHFSARGPGCRLNGTVGLPMHASRDPSFPRLASAKRTPPRTLAQRESELRTVIGTAAVAILTFDDEGAVHSFNIAAEHMFGYTLDEVIGRPVERLLIASDPDGGQRALPPLLEECDRSGGRLTCAAQARRKDGSTFPAELSLSKVVGFDLFTAVVRDIAHHHRVETLLADVALAEQERIGRDLHDTVGQTLAALALSADRAGRELECRRGAEVLAELATGIRGALSGVRAAARGLTRVATDARSLVNALQALAASVEIHHGIECQLAADAPEDLPEPVTEHLYRIASEAVSNAVHHAQPTRIQLRLAPDDGAWTLRIEDDGVGMPRRPVKGGIGHWIMRSRAAAIDADFHVGPGAAGGTVVTCRLRGAPWGAKHGVP